MDNISFDSDMDYSDNDCLEDDDYYKINDDYDIEQIDPSKTDPEHFLYDCLSVEEVERLLNESVEILSNNLQITPSLAKVLLHAHGWQTQEILQKYRDNSKLLNGIRRGGNPPIVSTTPPVSITNVSSSTSNCCSPSSATGSSTSNSSTSSSTNANIENVMLPPALLSSTMQSKSSKMCPVCTILHVTEKFCSLPCGHAFCTDCWAMHFEIQILQGISTDICCMASDCDVLVPEDLVLNLMPRPTLRNRYQQFAFQDYVRSHPQLRFCPGPNCQIVLRAKEPRAKRAICIQCKTTLCFKCGIDYHAPTDCTIIKKWLTKCADDSETANYISAHTKDCPKCHICIEKNGGCNHMQCYNCKYDFCWMCLGDWKAHGSEYYECSRYKENPNIAHESVHAQAREALKKYLHYYERWENHSKSLRLEKQTLDRLKTRINHEVMGNRGTWIDWQYLFVAASLLAKCRYTLQYTYPYAYFMEPGPRKELFEYQQAQLEAEIENLSWKIERAESTDRGDLENQMDIAEKRRTTLLKDFLDV